MTHTPEKMKLTIVRIGGGLRCVYVNNYRLVGNKPYVSEGGEYVDLEFTADDFMHTLPREWKTAVSALAGIPSEQIERDKALYPHVREMHDLIVWFCGRVMKGEVRSKRTYAAFMELLDKLGDDQ